jgi:hypothetical protein
VPRKQQNISCLKFIDISILPKKWAGFIAEVRLYSRMMIPVAMEEYISQAAGNYI